MKLTAAQRAALAAAAAHLDAGTFGAVLLHGVTGSGKTEVYLALIERALALGESALYLLPEIALTPQTLARIHARFGDRAAAIHSGTVRRASAAASTRRPPAGELRVVVGPRSALFAPVADLGVIVVDEEHETSYKQDEKPRYHARHAALVRGREAEAVVMLGSATPDLESVANARAGRFDLLPPGRPPGRRRPAAGRDRGHAGDRRAGRPVAAPGGGGGARPWRRAGSPSSTTTAAASPGCCSAATAARCRSAPTATSP